MAPPPTHREIPMELLNLGLARTGTTSTRFALQEIGYKNVHHMQTVGKDAPWEPEMWVAAYNAKFGGIGKPFGREEFDILLGRYDAVTDYPAIAFAEELMDAYPEAKLLLTIRDSPQAWTKSITETLWQMHLIMFGPSFNPTVELVKMSPWGRMLKVPEVIFKYSPLGRWGEDEAANRRFYEEYNENIKKLAKDRGRELLVFNVKEGWGPLCAYLGKEVPEGPYPRVNETKDMQAMFKRVRLMKAVVNTVIFTGAAAMVGGLGWYLRKQRFW